MKRNSPKFLEQVMRAESNGHDLHDAGERIHVLREDEDGECYSIGAIDKKLMYASPNLFWEAVDRIKFHSYVDPIKYG